MGLLTRGKKAQGHRLARSCCPYIFGTMAAPAARTGRRRRRRQSEVSTTNALRWFCLLQHLQAGCSSYTFTSNSRLQSAVAEWTANPTQASSTYGEISTWNVGLITDMSFLFEDTSSFNDDISSWDVSNVLNMVSCLPLPPRVRTNFPSHVSHTALHASFG